MSRISKEVIKEMGKVLEKQFNIKLELKDGKYTFTDLEDNSAFTGESPTYTLPDLDCVVKDIVYKNTNGKQIRLVEGAYSTGSGDMTILLADNNSVWGLYGDNYPRDNKRRTITTPVDCPHIVLNYKGSKNKYTNLMSCKLRMREDSEYVKIITEDDDDEMATFCDMNIAEFYINGVPVVFVTTDGIYINYDNKKLDGPVIRESSSFTTKRIKELIAQRIYLSYEHRPSLDNEVLKRKVAFLIGRVDELKEYINTHRDDFLARIDRLADAKAEKKNNAVDYASKIITAATNSYREEIASIDTARRAFQKTFPCQVKKKP